MKVRAKEAEMLRGNLEQLAALDAQPDVEVVAKWAWTSAIVGAITVFGIGVSLNLFQNLVPLFVYSFLWLILKLAVLSVLLMFSAAAWLTFKPPHMLD
ncbi:MAG TPA: hypothetical protein V6D22_13515 [Candidatus Obscuribacterales bacterium]